jgi:hypothetical protein
VGSKDSCIVNNGYIVVNALLNLLYLYLVSKISFRKTPLIGFRLVIFLLILLNVSSFLFYPGGRVNSVT